MASDNTTREVIELQKRATFMALMESLKVFDIKSGTLTVNFDAAGVISSVEIKKHYRPK